MLKATVVVVGKVVLAGIVLFLTGCVVEDRDYRRDGHYYRNRHQGYYERVDYRYGGDRQHDRHRQRYRDHYGRCD